MRSKIHTASGGSLPSGTVTFAFTDIEGSTRRWEDHPDAMRDALWRHDALVRAAIAAHDGHVFKAMGDAFCAAFARPDAALAAMIDVQRRLAAEDFSAVDGLRVRAAIHTGSAQERDDDYFGPVVNRVARLLAVAHGGQIVVSETAAKLARDAGWSSDRLRDLGSHRLKDLTALERVFQAVEPGFPQDFPPLRSLERLANNLPAQSSSFVGREREVEEIATLLDRNRLVTLSGSGGVGKTRTALQVGASLLSVEGQAVWFVELASVTAASGIAPAVAAATDARVSLHASDDEGALFEILSTTTQLLILDNCEHLIDGVANFVERALKKTQLRILCTSRQRLSIAGEAVYRMPSLSVAEGVALFAARASAINPRFQLDDENTAIVAEICRRLDGIPLALELAAARIDILTPKALHDRLADRFRLLSRGDRTALPRQQTLRALIDWGYELLDDGERRVLVHLSVFAGSFTLDAAECVALGDGVLEIISQLADKSLLAVDLESDDTPRYRMLETIREYALERFVADPARDEVRQRFVAWAITAMEEADRGWASEPSNRWVERCERELENVRAALDWSLRDARDEVLGIVLAGKAARLWGRVAPTEGVRWLALARERLGSATPPRARADLAFAEAQARIALEQHERALSAARDAVELFADLSAGELLIAEAQRVAGFALARLGGRDEAIRLLAEVLETMRRSGSAQLVGYAAQDLALAYCEAGRLVDGAALFEEALAAFESAGNERGITASKINLAEVAFLSGDTAGAIAIAEAIRITERSGFSPAIVVANLAGYFIASSRWDEAAAAVRRALDLSSEPGNVYFPIAVQHAATVALGTTHPAGPAVAFQAVRLLGFADRSFERIGRQRDASEEQFLATLLKTLSGVLANADIERLRSEGALWSFERGSFEVRRIGAPAQQRSA